MVKKAAMYQRPAGILVYPEKHTTNGKELMKQKCAIEFVDYVISRFPFRIHTVQTDNGHEFQALFHWHCEDLGIRHVYNKKASPHLNSKVERSHLTDQQEFYQLLE